MGDAGVMIVVNDPEETRGRLDDARSKDQVVGFVPTMGSLHDGHRALLLRSVESCDVTVLSIFVNPLQFGPGEDLEAYPRSFDADVAMAADVGVDIIFAPAAEAMYPEPPLTLVRVRELSSGLESVSRPTHFDGVTSVVAKLFNLIGACSAFFGEKDYQQLVQIRRLARDLSFPVEVVGCTTVREPDGLALSSRNSYLDPKERVAATALSRALRVGIDLIAAGETSAAAVEDAMAALVELEPLAELDYAAVRHPATLAAVDRIEEDVRLLIAARFGATRLIDNAAGRRRLGE